MAAQPIPAESQPAFSHLVEFSEWKDFVLLRLMDNLPAIPPPELERAIMSAIGAGDGESIKSKPCFIDCTQCERILPHEVRYFLALKKKVGHFFLLTHSKYDRSLKELGVRAALPHASTVKRAFETLGIPFQLKVEAGFINPFLGATSSVLTSQDAGQVKAGKPHLLTKPFVADITGRIPLVGPIITGSLSIAFPNATFLKLLSKVMGEEITTVDSENDNFAAELTNMIYGAARRKLNERGYALQPSMPIVLRDSPSPEPGAAQLAIAIPFECDFGPLTVALKVDA